MDQQGFGSRGLQMIVLLWFSLSMTQDVQLVFSGNDFCLKMMYCHPAREGGLTIDRYSLGLALPFNEFCLATTYRCLASGDCQTVTSKDKTGKTCGQDIAQTMDNDYCIDMTYRRPASKGKASTKHAALVLPSPSVLQDIEYTFSNNGFCLATMYQCSASGDCQTGASNEGMGKQGVEHEDVQTPAVWLKNGSLVMATICDLQRRIDVRRAPKMDSKKYGIAPKDNEMGDQLKKGTPFEEDLGLGNCVGCLTHSATVFLCEQIIEI
ncbi:hypothetical protein IW261DRAFT_1565078 [Armillaria novae-zelandiae]|uniref:Uncharacterized protein n=1 Tax=Armillaria novae-zelandiae TaxID=153914 RepID=A0AA39P7F4_9AGAR|nr:hypothetical protein IW261DRAFT_1565078 [Armillaria novae-zelandiae]